MFLIMVPYFLYTALHIYPSTTRYAANEHIIAHYMYVLLFISEASEWFDGKEMNDVLSHDSALQDYTGLMRWNLLWIMPLVQDQSLDLWASSSARYHCTMDSPTCSDDILNTLPWDYAANKRLYVTFHSLENDSVSALNLIEYLIGNVYWIITTDRICNSIYTNKPMIIHDKYQGTKVRIAAFLFDQFSHSAMFVQLLLSESHYIYWSSIFTSICCPIERRVFIELARPIMTIHHYSPRGSPAEEEPISEKVRRQHGGNWRIHYQLRESVLLSTQSQ